MQKAYKHTRTLLASLALVFAMMSCDAINDLIEPTQKYLIMTVGNPDDGCNPGGEGVCDFAVLELTEEELNELPNHQFITNLSVVNDSEIMLETQVREGQEAIMDAILADDQFDIKNELSVSTEELGDLIHGTAGDADFIQLSGCFEYDPAIENGPLFACPNSYRRKGTTPRGGVLYHCVSYTA